MDEAWLTLYELVHDLELDAIHEQQKPHHPWRKDEDLRAAHWAGRQVAYQIIGREMDAYSQLRFEFPG